MVGVGAVRQDVGEGLVRVFCQRALGQGFPVRADLPDLQVRGTVQRVLGGCDKLQISVVIEIGYRIVPGVLGCVLLQLADLGGDKPDLQVDIRGLDSFRKGGPGTGSGCTRLCILPLPWRCC